MGKVKINLVSGGVVEKPLITAFKGTNGNYVVLDNEMNGSMGLPIILVCKLLNDKLVKISDQNEWGAVKENLKSIIAGGKIEYIKINDVLPADDVYYTQLTLPIPSYDILKNSYKVENTSINSNDTASIFDINDSQLNSGVNVTVENGIPVQNVVSNPVNNTTMGVEMPQAPMNDVVSPAPQTPIVDQSPVNSVNNINNVNNVDPTAPIIDLGIPNVTPESPTSFDTNSSVQMSSEPKIEQSVAMPNQNVSQPENTSKLVSEVVSGGVSEDIFKNQKEAFMQACENMFDALVQRFEKELEKNK